MAAPGPRRRNEAGTRIMLAATPSCSLVVDREHRRVTLFSHAAHGDYLQTYKVPFGDKLELPDPFGFALDTASFAD
jgi:hypothetical protein